MPAGCSEEDSGIRALSKDQQEQKPLSCQERCTAGHLSGTHCTAETRIKLFYGNDSNNYDPHFSPLSLAMLLALP